MKLSGGAVKLALPSIHPSLPLPAGTEIACRCRSKGCRPVRPEKRLASTAVRYVATQNSNTVAWTPSRQGHSFVAAFIMCLPMPGEGMRVICANTRVRQIGQQKFVTAHRTPQAMAAYENESSLPAGSLHRQTPADAAPSAICSDASASLGQAEAANFKSTPCP